MFNTALRPPLVINKKRKTKSNCKTFINASERYESLCGLYCKTIHIINKTAKYKIYFFKKEKCLDLKKENEFLPQTMFFNA